MEACNQLNSQIQTIMPWIVENYRLNHESTQKCKDLLYNLIVQLENGNFSIQRLYLLYYICEIMNKEKEEMAINFFSTLFPIPLKKNIAAFIKQLISLSICLNNNQVLTATTSYIDKEQIKLSEEDIKELPSNLAKNSPLFAATLIDKGFFNITSKSRLYSPQLLTEWLISINETDPSQKITFNGQSLIRYSLLGGGQGNSDLHYNILDAINKKKFQPLSNQFMIDMATQLFQRSDEELSSKYAQILVIGAKNGICNTLLSSNQMKNNLMSLFSDNLLIKAVVSMKPSK